MPKSGYTGIMIVLDRSGSMQSIRHSVIEGLHKVRDDQKNLPGTVTFDLAIFDTEYEYVTKLATPENFTVDLNPRNRTALYDAIVKGVSDYRATIESLPESERPEHVQFIVATDGEENASRVADALLVKDTIQWHAENLEWDFTFLGSNQDAVFAGAALGFEGKKSMTFSSTASGVAGVSSSLSDYIAQTRRGEDAAYTDAHRTASV